MYFIAIWDLSMVFISDWSRFRIFRAHMVAMHSTKNVSKSRGSAILPFMSISYKKEYMEI